MSPGENNTRRSFTFITGNPRSKQNVTQIRRHAGQHSITKVQRDMSSSTSVFSTHLRADQAMSSHSNHVTSAVDPSRSSLKYSDPGAELSLLSYSIGATSSSDSVLHTDEQIPSLPTEAHTQTPDHGLAIYHSSYTSAWTWEIEPSTPRRSEHSKSPAEVSTSTFGSLHDTQQTIRGLRIRQLVNVTEDGDDEVVPDRFAGTDYTVPMENLSSGVDCHPHHQSGSIRRRDGLDRLADPESSNEEQRASPSSLTSTSGKGRIRHANASRGRQTQPPSQVNPSQRRRLREPLLFNLAKSGRHRWRTGAASRGLPAPYTIGLTRDQSMINDVLTLTTNFYMAGYEDSWSPQVLHGSSGMSLTASLDNFAGSITTAAGLIAVGQIDSASALLARVLPTLRSMLTTQHPQLFYLLAEMSLDQTASALGHLRGLIKEFAASLSPAVLSSAHPITRLLNMRISSSQAATLREIVQRKIYDLHKRLFHPTSTQATNQAYFLARMLGQIGQRSEAKNIIGNVVAIWEAQYGRSGDLVLVGLLELAKIELTEDNPDLQRAENVVRETLGRIQLFHSPASDVETHGNETNRAQSHHVGAIHSRMACLRTLGRVYVLREDPSAALHYYTQALKVGIDALGPDGPAALLARADVDTVSQLSAQAT